MMDISTTDMTAKSHAVQRRVMATNITQVLIPAYQHIRPVVDLPDGGLRNPMPLLFDASLGLKPVAANLSSFSYPQMTNVTRPNNNEDVAYMTVSLVQPACLSAQPKWHGETQEHVTPALNLGACCLKTADM